jgi:hypothetical protein
MPITTQHGSHAIHGRSAALRSPGTAPNLAGTQPTAAQSRLSLGTVERADRE